MKGKVPPPPPFNFTMVRNDLQNETIMSENSVDRNPFTDWLQNIFGRPPPATEKPTELVPPEHCDECSE